MREVRAREREATKENELRRKGTVEFEFRRLTKEQELWKLRLQAREGTSSSLDALERTSGGAEEARRMFPAFNEKGDNLDAYIKRFERAAEGQGWPADKWALALSLGSTGEALRVVKRISPTDSLDNHKVKVALLQRFRYTSKGYSEKLKFRDARPEQGETQVQFATRLTRYFDRWSELAEVGNDFQLLKD